MAASTAAHRSRDRRDVQLLRWAAGYQGFSWSSPAFGFGGRCDTSDVFQRLGDESDDRWIFTPNRVWIERRDGTVVEERFEPRASFAGHVRETPWDRLHLTYFLGYAIWNYLTAPFLFARTASPRVSSRRTSKIAKAGASSR